jgi:hypothetical protein
MRGARMGDFFAEREKNRNRKGLRERLSEVL